MLKSSMYSLILGSLILLGPPALTVYFALTGDFFSAFIGIVACAFAWFSLLRK